MILHEDFVLSVAFHLVEGRLEILHLGGRQASVFFACALGVRLSTIDVLVLVKVHVILIQSSQNLYTSTSSSSSLSSSSAAAAAATAAMQYSSDGSKCILTKKMPTPSDRA